MVTNIVLVLATLIGAYLCGHLIAVRRARATDRAEPDLLNYAAHRQLWSEGMQGYRRDPWYWGIVVAAIVIVNVLTKSDSFGVAFAVAAAFGFGASWAYRTIRRHRTN